MNKHRWNERTKTASMTKLQRIQWLTDCGLNTPRYVTVRTKEQAVEASEQFKTASIRCEPQPAGKSIDHLPFFQVLTEKNKMPPHLPWLDNKANISFALRALIELGWTPIICEGISFKMNQFAGVIQSVATRNPNIYDFLLEAALPTPDAPVGVRTVSHGGKIDIALKLPNSIADLRPVGSLFEIYGQIKTFRQGPPVNLEFGYLTEPKGWKPSRTIFWEGHIVEDRTYER